MSKRVSLHVALGLLVLGVILTTTGGYGYIQADTTAVAEGTKAIKAILAFGGSLITVSVVMMALLVGA